MIARPTIVVLAAIASLAPVVAAPAARALSPREASEMSQLVGRPLTSFVRNDQPTRMHALGARLPVFLNRHGGTYSCGNNDDSSRNISSVACGENGNDAGGTVGAFSGSDADWQFVMSCVTDEFSRFNITVTDQQPASGEYVTAVVGGTPDQVDEPFGVGGVAPFSCGLIPQAVVYAFADVYQGDNQGICETIAQEVSHAFGLDHEYLCQDPMTYLEQCGAKTFQDTDASCGEFQPRECNCGGSSQNSVQTILQVIGASDGTVVTPPPPDNTPPTVSLASPDDKAILPANSTIQVTATASDNQSLPLVELQWDFTGESMFCPSQDASQAYTCTQSGNTYTWTIQVGVGSRTFRVHVKDGAGNDATSDSRSIWLSTDGSGPPQDSGPPVVFIASPLDGAQVTANAQLDVIGQVGDDSGLSRVELVWAGGPGGDFTLPCPAQDQGDGTSCETTGSTYTWHLNVGTGDRTFSVRATDVVGNVVTTDAHHITLVQNPQTAPNDEGNETVDSATSVKCGDTLDLHAGDADWFEVTPAQDQKVTFHIDGDAKGDVSIVATRGAGELLEDGDSVVELTGDGSTFDVGVLPDNANAGSYTMTVTCEAPRPAAKKNASAFGCTSSGTPAPVAFALVALAVVRRRRRR